MGQSLIRYIGDHLIFIKGGFKMKQPNEPSPPQQVVVQAPTNSRDDNAAIKEAYSVKAATVLGVVHIICGIIAFSCEIDVLVWPSRGPPGTLGTGIWSSVFFFISGGLAIGGAQSGKKCLVTATMIMAIVSAVCAGILLIMSAIFLSVTGGRSYSSYNYGSYHYGSQNYYIDKVINKVPSYSLLIAMGATMLIVAIVSAALTCKARERSGIQGGFMGDCCTVTWCCGLDFIQTYKEVNPKESLLCGNERIV